MKENLKKHCWYYVTFICFELSGLGIVLFFLADKYIQMIVVLMMVLFYIFWSIFHYYVHHRLTLKIFLEYLLIGAVGEVVIFFLLQ